MFGGDYHDGVAAGRAQAVPTYHTNGTRVAAILVVAVLALVLGGGGGGALNFFGWLILFLTLAGASLGAGLVPFLALSLLVALSKQPGRFGSPGRAFVYAAIVSFVGGVTLMWVGYESVVLVAREGAAAGGAVTAVAGGIGRLISIAAYPLIHGLWQSPALSIAQGIGGIGSGLSAILMLALPVSVFTLALRRLCGTALALALGIVTQAGILFVAMAVLSGMLQQG